MKPQPGAHILLGHELLAEGEPKVLDLLDHIQQYVKERGLGARQQRVVADLLVGEERHGP